MPVQRHLREQKSALIPAFHASRLCWRLQGGRSTIAKKRGGLCLRQQMQASYLEWASHRRKYDYSSNGGTRAIHYELMSSAPIICGANLADGNKCSESATVTRTQYVYDRVPAAGGPSDFTLKEIHYTAFCPKCGERKVIEAH
jgi:hypothetical protein